MLMSLRNQIATLLDRLIPPTRVAADPFEGFIDWPLLRVPVRPTQWRSPYPGAVIEHRLTLAPPAGVRPELN